VLLEARRQVGRPVGFFSGVEFTVDPQRGLTGTCDFLFSRSTEQLAIEAPAITIVEAKREDINAGIGQCLAEMVGARVFNERNEEAVEVIYGGRDHRQHLEVPPPGR
jgi:hypothetical protein